MSERNESVIVKPGTVLKRHQVRVADAPVRPGTVPTSGEGAGRVGGVHMKVDGPGPEAAEARIVRQDDAGAVVEITCPCGQKVYLQCNYKT